MGRLVRNWLLEVRVLRRVLRSSILHHDFAFLRKWRSLVLMAFQTLPLLTLREHAVRAVVHLLHLLHALGCEDHTTGSMRLSVIAHHVTIERLVRVSSHVAIVVALAEAGCLSLARFVALTANHLTGTALLVVKHVLAGCTVHIVGAHHYRAVMRCVDEIS